MGFKTLFWKIVAIVGIGIGVASQVSSQGSSEMGAEPGIAGALRAFQCDRLSGPILLSRASSGWAVSGLGDRVIADEFDFGFRLTSPEDPNFLGFLRETEISWSLMILSSSGSFESDCKTIDGIISWVLLEATLNAIEGALTSDMQSEILRLEGLVGTLQEELTEARTAQADAASLEHQIISLQFQVDALTNRLNTLDEALRSNKLEDWAREMLAELETLPGRLAISHISSSSVPPLTGSERDSFRAAIHRCWVVDPGSESARVVTTVAFEMDPEGRVLTDSIVMLRTSGGAEYAIKSAFESARRAILRCQANGYSLPQEKYEQWRYVEMTFNPSEMRIR